VELFLDPELPWPLFSVGWRLLKKKLGFRTLMDVIPLDAGLVGGSHGRLTDRPEQGPLLLASLRRPDRAEAVACALYIHIYRTGAAFLLEETAAPRYDGATLMDLNTAPFVVIDVETTGLSPAEERVCEVGAIKLVGGREEARYHTLVRPDRRVSEGARAKHGITDDMLRDAPPFGTIAPDLRKFIAGTILVAQNAEFDVSFLNAEFQRAGMSKLALPAIDTITLARKVKPGLSTYNLDNLAYHFKVQFTERHRSIGDCEVTGHIFWKCVESLRPKSVEELVRKGTSRR
jgi:DNA polymerase III epsilon subunit